MKRDPDAVRIVLEQEVPELRKVGGNVIVEAIVLYLFCNMASLSIYFYFFASQFTLQRLATAFVVFNLLSYGVGRMLNGPSSDAGKTTFVQGGRMSRNFFSRTAGNQMMAIGLVLMVLQFLFFGVFASVEQIREAIALKDDPRSRIASGVLIYLLENYSASRSQLLKGLEEGGVDRSDAERTIDFMKEKTIIQDSPDGLVISPPIRRLYPS